MSIANDELALNNRNQKKIAKNKNAQALCIHTTHADADADADADSDADSDAYSDADSDENSDADSTRH